MPSQYTPATSRRRAVNSEVARLCDYCGDPYVKTVKYGYRPSRFCSKVCSSRWGALHRAPLSERFWAKVQKGAGCWNWLATRNKSGYGKIGDGGHPPKMVYAHRVAYTLASGETLTTADDIGHTCDQPSCVRNDDEGTYEVRGVLLPRWGHLFRGTHADNVADAVQKGRVYKVSAFAKRLTAGQVAAICGRYEDGELQSALATEFGVSPSYVSQLVNFRRRGDRG